MATASPSMRVWEVKREEKKEGMKEETAEYKTPGTKVCITIWDLYVGLY